MTKTTHYEYAFAMSQKDDLSIQERIERNKKASSILALRAAGLSDASMLEAGISQAEIDLANSFQNWEQK